MNTEYSIFPNGEINAGQLTVCPIVPGAFYLRSLKQMERKCGVNMASFIVTTTNLLILRNKVLKNGIEMGFSTAMNALNPLLSAEIIGFLVAYWKFIVGIIFLQLLTGLIRNKLSYLLIGNILI